MMLGDLNAPRYEMLLEDCSQLSGPMGTERIFDMEYVYFIHIESVAVYLKKKLHLDTKDLFKTRPKLGRFYDCRHIGFTVHKYKIPKAWDLPHL